MSDAVLAVTKYRDRVKAELATVDGFLHMVEEFSKAPDPEERLALMKTTTNAPHLRKSRRSIGPVLWPTRAATALRR